MLDDNYNYYSCNNYGDKMPVVNVSQCKETTFSSDTLAGLFRDMGAWIAKTPKLITEIHVKPIPDIKNNYYAYIIEYEKDLI
jgi:hypothetical protein